MRRLAAALARDRDPASPFPWAGVALDGWVENALMEQPATEVEDRYRAVLRDNRARDAAAGRTTDGPHLTDLEVLYGPKGIAAAQASTGEQKALLIGLVLAHAGLVAEMTRLRAAAAARRSDRASRSGRRAALYDALAALDAQVWMTGADPAPFADVASRAQVFAVSPGRVDAGAVSCVRVHPDTTVAAKLALEAPHLLRLAALRGARVPVGLRLDRDFCFSARSSALNDPSLVARVPRASRPPAAAYRFGRQTPPTPLTVARHCWHVVKPQL